MKPAVRFRLHFGPYRSPKFTYGKMLRDTIRGDVKVVGLSSGRIPWPVGRSKSLVVCGDLINALRQESGPAIAHWWGVSLWRVYQWRRELGWRSQAEGTRRLRVEYCKEPAFKRTQRKAWAKAQDPLRLEKIAASKRGKKRPASIGRAVARAHRGHRHTDEARRKMSETHKRLGTRVPGTRPWTEAEEYAVRTMSTEAAVIATGRTLSAIRKCRHILGLPDGRRRGSRRWPVKPDDAPVANV